MLEITSAVVAAVGDEDDRLPCNLDIGCRRDVEERAEVAEVVWTGGVRRKQFERYEMARRGDRSDEAGKHLELVRCVDDLALDSRRCEENVDQNGFCTAGHEPHGRETLCGLVLNAREHLVAVVPQSEDKFLRIVVTVDGHGDVDVARESRLASNADRKGADERPSRADMSKVIRDPSEELAAISQRSDGWDVPASRADVTASSR